MPLTGARPDHVAVAVPSFDVADARWRDQLGGRWISWYSSRNVFRVRQLTFRGGAKLELLQPHERDPHPDRSFVRRFLARHGAQIHHVTLKVPDLRAAIAALAADGLDVVDVDDVSDPLWKEAFLRPSQIGGLIVQIAESPESDADWAAKVGFVPEPPPADGTTLVGPLLEHDDLDEAARVWRALGGTVTRDGDMLEVRWGDAPLAVRIRGGARRGPVGILMAGAAPHPQDPDLGAAVLPAR